MYWYDLFVFLHVVAVIVWLGGGVVLLVLTVCATRSRDPAHTARVIADTAWLGTRYFAPSAIAALVFGLLATWAGSWSFGELWITLGFLGFIATFVTGFVFVRPRAERLAASMRASGELTPEAAQVGAELQLISRIDFVVLFAVVADMVMKPTTSNPWPILFILLAGGAAITLVVTGGRATRTPLAGS